MPTCNDVEVEEPVCLYYCLALVTSSASSLLDVVLLHREKKVFALEHLEGAHSPGFLLLVNL